MKDLKEIFANNLTALRTENKMTQLELGNAISYSDKAVSKWERAEAVPDAYVLLQLASIFGVTVDFLLKDHASDKMPRAKRTNYPGIAALSIIAVWTAFAIAYIITSLAESPYPLLFMYAGVVSFIMLLVFNTLWGIRAFNIVLVCALVISIITTVYLIFLFAGYNFFQLLFLNIPATLIVICCFNIRIKTRVAGLVRTAKNKTKNANFTDQTPD